MNGSDIAKIADELIATGELLRASGDDAVRLCRDWQTPLRSSAGVRGAGPTVRVEADQHGDAESVPVTSVEAAVMSPDPLSFEYDRLLASMKRAFTDALTLRLQVLRVTSDATIQSGRMGIGNCYDCNRYCDGRTQRLSHYKGTDALVCQSCRMRRDRGAA